MASNLITLQEYKTWEGLSSPNQDAEIETLIPKVSALIKTYCRRTFIDFVDEFKTEVFNGGRTLQLAEFPVLQISSVETSSDYGQTYTALTEYVDWVLNVENGELVHPILSEFPSKLNGYRVTYTAGYEEIPEDLKLAVKDLITYYIKNDASVHSPKVPGSNSVQIEYISTTNLPAHIKRVLDMYSANYN